MTDRELDALVAEKVMGGKIEHDWVEPFGGDLQMCRACERNMMDSDRPRHCTPSYSTSIEAAWEVMEKLKDRVGDKERELLEVNWLPAKNKWVAGIWCYEQKMLGGSVARASFVASADSAPRAICLAALKAFGVEVPAA